MMNQFCIVGTGRSGSSFLANILALSGGDFAMQPSKDWDSVRGDMEHPLAHTAYAYFYKIHRLENSLLPTSFFAPFYKRKLNYILDGLRDVQYIKSSKLVYVVPELAKVNPDLKIIVVYRDFNDYARSRHAKFGWDMERLRSEYVNAYSTALLQVSIWGGVVISYDELLDTSKEEWAQSLNKLTDIETSDLLKNRNTILKKPTMKRNEENVYFKDVILIQDMLKKHTNVI